MKILLACEESQAVCTEFRKRGHEAFSCDILPCSGVHPEWHIQRDVTEILDTHYLCGCGHRFGYDLGKYGCPDCCGEKTGRLFEWDMMIAFPPCTHLAVSGAKHFEKKRDDGRQREAIEFFMKLFNAPIEKKAIENPNGIISGNYIAEYFPDLQEEHHFPIKPTQIIHPYYFGDKAQKSTCLWLIGLPPLYHNDRPNLFDDKVTHVDKGDFHITKGGKKIPAWYNIPPSEDRNKMRSKTFEGIAKAMSEQWG